LSSGNSICVGDILKMLAHGLEAVNSLISTVMGTVASGLAYPIEQGMNQIPGFSLSEFDRVMSTLTTLDEVVVNGVRYEISKFDMFSLAGFEGLIRVPVELGYALASLAVLVVVVKLFSFIDKRAEVASQSCIGAFIGLMGALVFAALRIKSFSDSWNEGLLAFTIKFGFNSNIKWYVLSLFAAFLGVVLMALTRNEERKKKQGKGTRGHVGELVEMKPLVPRSERVGEDEWLL
jgi:hypothetical protein